MDKKLEETIQLLKRISEDMHNRGIMFQGVTESIAEWNFGYSEGLEYAIESIETLFKEYLN